MLLPIMSVKSLRSSPSVVLDCCLCYLAILVLSFVPLSSVFAVDVLHHDGFAGGHELDVTQRVMPQ
jgi:hypothetical protein